MCACSHSIKPKNVSVRKNFYLARQDVAKGREGVVQGLVVDGLVKILNEDVPHATLSQGWITLRPHDAHRPPLDHIEVHGVQSTLS